jgi:predicted DNA-binding transcriptional regulator AlpA
MSLTVIPEAEGDNRLLPARLVRRRYSVSSMSIHRWLKDPNLAFPRPILIGRFRYWHLAELIAWEATQPRTKSEAA